MTNQSGFIEQLRRRYETPLTAYLTNMVGSREIAQELSQEAFEKMHQMYRPDHVIFPRAMLFKVATDLALMHLGQRRTENKSLTSSADIKARVNHESSPETIVEDVPDHGLRPERQALADQIGQHLATTIKELRPNLRSVFVLAHVQGKPRREIAAALGVSEKRIDKRLTKALKQCRERLASRGVDLADADLSGREQ
ncbi:MAG TPA: sigma-70 family RNA polymerase sigma factor [Steroidobacteraceae bacterium]|nr:sigma-70 family RNA polymerase sigma factor [Steroidobacteraceae bacterium]